MLSMGSPGSTDGKESAFNTGDPGSIRGSGKIPWRRQWLSTPVFLPGEFCGQRSLAGYSPVGYNESDTTEMTYNTHSMLSVLQEKRVITCA